MSDNNFVYTMKLLVVNPNTTASMTARIGGVGAFRPQTLVPNDDKGHA
jgi:hypothetical protein